MLKPVIKVENLSKRYRLGLKEKQAKTLAGQLGNIIKSPWDNFQRLRRLSRFGEEDQSVFWALKDVSFEVKEGEVLGIIGKNGAGKSTLLKILSQITEPTSGRVELHGRVASLLEVGTGFHPELTGRENIYMNGTILGMTRKEIDQKLEEIIDFSGVEKFIDTPVKFYSSGMKVRLGFSVAAHLEPEILIIDEVLAVGDYEFQQKCLGKMEDVSKNQGRTVLFVSHNMGAVKNLCNRVICLSGGQLTYNGDSKTTVELYLRGKPSGIESVHKRNFIQNRISEKEIYLRELSIESAVETGQQFKVKTNIFSTIKSSIQFSFTFKTLDLQPVFQIYSGHTGDNFQVKEGENQLSLEIPSLPLSQGDYKCNVWIGSNCQVYDFIEGEVLLSVKEGAIGENGPISTYNGYPVISKANWELI
ncbi:polysaccharide ABC transporter ATP-binding protein [Negadavirga shengliensis]|uniref:Polysaccharide ABC transporter ATP-binding protein n=1 Tax=Negadavirga shengliensis TaxID=1389218 RepID=A0ABV9T4E2_9BACT